MYVKFATLSDNTAVTDLEKSRSNGTNCAYAWLHQSPVRASANLLFLSCCAHAKSFDPHRNFAQAMSLIFPFWRKHQSPRVNLAFMGIRTVMEYIAVVMGGAALLTGMVRGLGILPSLASAGLITSTYAALVT